MPGVAALSGRIAILLLGAAFMHTPFAQSVPQPLSADDPDRSTALEAATAPLREAFGDRVRAEVERLDRMGRWVFLQATMHGAGGGRPDYAGTAYAEHAAAGSMSDVYVALLKRADAAPAGEDTPHWELLDHAIGPGDVAWLTWPEEHAAPRALFGF